MRYVCAIFYKSKYARNAYFRKNQQNLKTYKHNWIGPHDITTLKLLHMRDRYISSLHAKNYDGDIART